MIFRRAVLAAAVLGSFACAADTVTTGHAVLAEGTVELGTTPTTISVRPSHGMMTQRPSVCLGLDSLSHVVEMPYNVLRRRTPADTAFFIMNFERRTLDTIGIAGEAERTDGSRHALSRSTYVSSHQVCFSPQLDSLSVVRITSTERISVRGVTLSVPTK